jgi:hypothetical protein
VGLIRDPNQFIQHRAQNWHEHNAARSVNYFKDWITKHNSPTLIRTPDGNSIPRSSESTIYSYGAFLTEWMVGKIGISGLIKLMKETEIVGWDKAFTNNMGGSSSEFLTEMATYLQTEMNIIASNMWVMLPGCKLDASKKIFEYNKGVCNSNASFLN